MESDPYVRVRADMWEDMLTNMEEDVLCASTASPKHGNGGFVGTNAEVEPPGIGPITSCMKSPL